MMARILHLALWRAAHPKPAAPLPTSAATAPTIAPPALEEAVTAVRAKVLPLRRALPPPTPPEPAPLAPSAWDPDEMSDADLEVSRRDRDEDLQRQTVNGCKTLLLEIIRRAAYDWVLYRTSRRMTQRVLAENAYRWLFVEGPDTPDWAERQKEGKHITSFESICECLDLDPETVRKHVRRITPKNVMSVGRPAEYRRRDIFAGSGDDDYAVHGTIVEYDDGSDEPSY